MKKAIPIPILSSRTSTLFLVVSVVAFMALWTLLKGEYAGELQEWTLLDSLHVETPQWVLTFSALSMWLFAGLRLKAFLDRPSLSFERNRYSLLPLLVWVLPSLLFEVSLYPAWISLLAVEVFIQANLVDSTVQGMLRAFISGLICGLGLLISPTLALLTLIYLSVLQYLAMLQWRTVVWTVLGLGTPSFIIMGWTYVLSGQLTEWPILRSLSDSSTMIAWNLTWADLLWMTLGTALLIFGLFEANFSSSTANSKQRKLNQSATRALLILVFIFALVNSTGEIEGAQTISLFAMPSSILFSIVMTHSPNWVRVVYWAWLASLFVILILSLSTSA